jgi:hypothetical protein
MKAAHIIPYSVGVTNLAYIFGSALSEGFEILWSTKNKLIIHPVLEKIFNNGQIVIIPDPIDNDKYISIILS